ncbi:alanine racemase [Amphibacillus marinus]|uniref:Alanine racemase n=1 Tax=Amphibacillus marinus TaxID=872970 RepID=A0A1H8JP65_9BACI|nr:alanine racemase [Amphibacillus marinus]SEN82351.1 alanine racemase [Amphibacillus marinus]
MKSLSYRYACLQINLAAIKANVLALKARLNKSTAIIAVVKANGYGHGAVEVANAAIEAGATSLAVALLDEAVTLRANGITAPILVMGWVAPEFAQVAIDQKITLTVFQPEWLAVFYQQQTSGSVSIHVKLDTGMGRLGIRTTAEMADFFRLLDQSKVKVEGVFTHFATADEPDLAYYDQQNNRFNQLLAQFKQHHTGEVIVHTGNSAAAMRQPNLMYDAVRFGIGMYGLYPSIYMKQKRPFKLVSALSLKTRLTHVKQLAANEGISYGATYHTEAHEWVGTIPLGYADGIQRKWQGLDVLVNGKRMPLIGRICMDQCMVKLDRAYPIGTEVTFVGKQGDQEVSLEEVASHLDTINYEVACLFTARLPRIYLTQE